MYWNILQIPNHVCLLFCTETLKSDKLNNYYCKSTGYEPNDRGVVVRVPAGSRIFTSPYHPDRLWGPTCPLSNGYRGLFHRG
jgi:hypothetical protein